MNVAKLFFMKPKPLQMAKDYVVGDTIDQGWGENYQTFYIEDRFVPNHEFERLMSEDVRVDCIVPYASLKEWQSWLSLESTVFQLAKRITVRKDYHNVSRMSCVLKAHYSNLIKKRFPKDICAQFRENVTQEGT
jgi:hypothetical protein